MLFHWEGGYEVLNQDLRTANDCGQLWGATLRSAMRCCAASVEACWDMCMWLCVAYLKPRHAAGLKSDVDPAVFRTVIYSVRFEFHLNTNSHVLFLAFRWGGLRVSLHYSTACACGRMAAGVHTPLATAWLTKKGGVPPLHCVCI